MYVYILLCRFRKERTNAPRGGVVQTRHDQLFGFMRGGGVVRRTKYLKPPPAISTLHNVPRQSQSMHHRMKRRPSVSSDERRATEKNHGAPGSIHRAVNAGVRSKILTNGSLQAKRVQGRQLWGFSKTQPRGIKSVQQSQRRNHADATTKNFHKHLR